MSIQPLSNNTLSTYSPPASTKPATETTAALKETAPKATDSVRRDEAQRSNQVNTQEALRDATQKANLAIEGLRSDLKFTVDEETGYDVVRFVDVKTKEVIRQIPAQEMLVIAKRLDELRGLLIKERV